MPKDVIEIQESQEPLPFLCDNTETLEMPQHAFESSANALAAKASEHQKELMEKFNSKIPAPVEDAIATTQASEF